MQVNKQPGGHSINCKAEANMIHLFLIQLKGIQTTYIVCLTASKDTGSFVCNN